MSRDKLLKTFEGSSRKQFGSAAIKRGMGVVAMKRLTTGILSLDFATGGGLPAGRIIGFNGLRSSGKTTAAYRVCGHAQKLCSNCLRRALDRKVEEFVDAETGELTYRTVAKCDCYAAGLFVPKQYPDERKDEFAERVKGYAQNSYEEFRVAILDVECAMDYEWAKKVGLDTRLILYAAPSSAEEAIDMYDGLLRSGAVDLIVLDSIAAMTPSAEIEESAEKWQQGLQARLVNKMVRKSVSASADVVRDFGRPVTQIWINQIRMKIGVMFGPPDVKPGGMGQDFATSIDISFRASNSKYDKNDVDLGLSKDNTMQVADKVATDFTVDKNKTAPPKMSGRFEMYLTGQKAGQIDERDMISGLLTKFDELREDKGKWWLGAQQFKNKGEALKSLNDPIVWQEWRERLLKRMFASL